jgi:pectinesterase
LRPEVWNDWKNTEAERTVRYAESNSTGPGAKLQARVRWVQQLTAQEVRAITLNKVLGVSDGWNPKTSQPASN